MHDLGECEVKHGVLLHVVNLYTEELGNPEAPEKFKKAGSAKRAGAKRPKRPKNVGRAAGGRAPRPAALRWGGITAAVLLLAGIVFWLFHSRSVPTQPGEKTAASPSALALNVPEKSIAVLPFENRSEDKANAYFADGIQDEILTRLSKIADLKVISRTSTERYKSAPANLREIASQLGVANVVEGSVQKSQDQVRVNVQLINAATDAHLWADTYDRKLTDIFTIESEIAKTIADTLQAKLTGSEERAIAARPTENPEAYQLYLQGRFFWNKRTAVGSAEIDRLLPAGDRERSQLRAGLCGFGSSLGDTSGLQRWRPERLFASSRGGGEESALVRRRFSRRTHGAHLDQGALLLRFRGGADRLRTSDSIASE